MARSLYGTPFLRRYPGRKFVVTTLRLPRVGGGAAGPADAGGGPPALAGAPPPAAPRGPAPVAAAPAAAPRAADASWLGATSAPNGLPCGGSPSHSATEYPCQVGAPSAAAAPPK